MGNLRRGCRWGQGGPENFDLSFWPLVLRTLLISQTSCNDMVHRQETPNTETERSDSYPQLLSNSVFHLHLQIFFPEWKRKSLSSQVLLFKLFLLHIAPAFLSPPGFRLWAIWITFHITRFCSLPHCRSSLGNTDEPGDAGAARGHWDNGSLSSWIILSVWIFSN